jgi:general secretion pathway protein M
MSTKRLPPGALPALILLLAAVIALLTLAIGPFLLAHTIGEQIAARQQELAVQQGPTDGRGPSGGGLRGRTLDDLKAKTLLSGQTTGIAGASLHKQMNDLLLQHGATIASVQIMPTREEGALTRISARMSLTVSTDRLRDIVHMIETGTPLMVIDSLSARVAKKEQQDADPHFIGPLDVTLTVSGFVGIGKGS